MKKQFTVLLMLLALKATNANAQILNSGFENLNPDGTISNWMNYPIYAFGVGDSLIYDSFYFCYDTSDAHQGAKAMVLNNIWDYTANYVLPARVCVYDTSTSLFIGSPIFISAQSAISQQGHLNNFAFFYKYFPVNGDSAYAQLTLKESSGNTVGSGLIIITDSTTNYTYANVPITYTSTDTPAFYNLTFSTFYESTIGSHQASYNTRLFVDDVIFNGAPASTINIENDNESIKIYPNPVSDVLTFISQKQFQSIVIKITDLAGKIILNQQASTIDGEMKMDVSRLSHGMYLLQLESNGVAKSISKFIR